MLGAYLSTSTEIGRPIEPDQIGEKKVARLNKQMVTRTTARRKR